LPGNVHTKFLKLTRVNFNGVASIAREIQRVGLTGSAAVVDVVGGVSVGVVVGFAVMMTPEAVMASALTAPPPPRAMVGLGDVFGLTATTLPAELVAEAVAAAVAAVERSPATAAKEAWNCPSWKLATACWISRAAC
jgi:hypothetical protein